MKILNDTIGLYEDDTIEFDEELGVAPKHPQVGRHPLLPGINIAVKGAKGILPFVKAGYAVPMRRRGKVVPGAYVPAIGVRDETWVRGYWITYTPAKGGYGDKPYAGMTMRTTKFIPKAEGDRLLGKTTTRKRAPKAPTRTWGGFATPITKTVEATELVRAGVPVEEVAARMRRSLPTMRKPPGVQLTMKFPKSVQLRLNEITKLLKLADVQREATSESNIMNRRRAFRSTVDRTLKGIQAKGCPPHLARERVIRVIMERGRR